MPFLVTLSDLLDQQIINTLQDLRCIFTVLQHATGFQVT